MVLTTVFGDKTDCVYAQWNKNLYNAGSILTEYITVYGHI